jgi:hypothetical protein
VDCPDLPRGDVRFVQCGPECGEFQSGGGFDFGGEFSDGTGVGDGGGADERGTRAILLVGDGGADGGLVWVAKEGRGIKVSELRSLN